jgi:leucyl aminopeptidase (aminopeptidase T)
MISDDRLEVYARLVVELGANVGPGQEVHVEGNVEHAPFVRALAEEAYRAGARYVDVDYLDQHVRRAMIEHASDEILSWTPPWLLARLRELGAEITYHDLYVPELQRDGLHSSELDPAVQAADLAVIVTAHPGIDHGGIASTVPTVDLRGVTRKVRATPAASTAAGKES